jgi:hypothetical protein
MLSDLLKSIPFLLSLAGLVLADRDVTNVSSDGLGCTATVASSSVGFNANFYNYALDNLIDFNNNDWIANSFTEYGLSKSTTGVTDPNFTFDALQVDAASLYGFQSINIEHTALQLTGYFIGMYNYLIFISFFFYSCHPI